jgi:hypothetical protein
MTLVNDNPIHIQLITSAECNQFFYDACMLDHVDPNMVTAEAIVAALADWTLVGIFDQDETLIGVAGVDQNGFGHIHIADEARFQWSIRSVCFDIGTLLLKEHEVVQYSIPLVNIAARKLAIFCGAIFVHQDEEVSLYKLTAKDLAKSPCAMRHNQALRANTTPPT